jgi:hypothetical protein
MKTTLEQFHNLLADAYAVCVNDTLYFVGYDNDDVPYISDSDGEGFVSFGKVDKNKISVTDRGLFFFIDDEPYFVKLLQLQPLNQ